MSPVLCLKKRETAGLLASYQLVMCVSNELKYKIEFCSYQCRLFIMKLFVLRTANLSLFVEV